MNQQRAPRPDDQQEADTEAASGPESVADHQGASHDDPRLREVTGDQGMPGSFIDSDRNLPGDQPTDTRGPTKSQLEGND